MEKKLAEGMDRAFREHPNPLFQVKRDGTISRMNEKAMEVLGYDDDLTGREFGSLVHEEDRQRFSNLCNTILSAGGFLLERFSIRKGSGESIYFNIEFLPLLKNGDVESFILAFLPPEPAGAEVPIEEVLKLKLKEEREFIKSVINKSGLAIYSMDMAGNIEIFNRKMEELSGYTKEECPTVQALVERLYPDEKYREVIRKVHENFVKNQHLRDTELTMTTKGGNLTTLSWNTTRIKNAEGTVVGYLAMGMDVTEKKKVQQWVKLQSSVFDKVIDAIIVLDVKGNILTWSGNARKIFGYAQEEMVGKQLKLLFLEGERELIHDTFLKAVNETGRYYRELEAIKRDGGVVSISLNASGITSEKGRNIAIVAVASDLSERKDFQDEITSLQEKIARLEGEMSTISGGRAALEQAVQELSLFQIQVLDLENFAIITTDTEGNITTFSKGAESISGLAGNDVIGRKLCNDVFLLEGWSFETLLEGAGKGSDTLPFSAPLKDGGDAAPPLFCEFKTLTDESGEPLSCILIACERGEEEKLSSVIESLSRLAIIGELTLGISHEIDSSFNYLVTNYAKLKEYTRNASHLIELYRSGAPLSNVEGFVRNINLKEMLADMEEVVEDSMKGILRVRNLAKDLKLYTPAGEKEVVYFNINEVIEAALSLMRRRIENRVNVVKEYGLTPVIGVDLNSVYRALINLIHHIGGNFETDAPEENRVRIITRADEDGVSVEMIDTGKGLPEEARTALLSGKGLPTSLLLEYPGLYLTRRMMDEVKGVFSIEQGDGGGNIYTLKFPVAKEEMEEVAVEEEKGKRGKILFIDDDKSQLNAYTRYFDPEFEVVTANSYSEALEKMKGEKGFRVIFFDLFMPESLGIKFFKEASAKVPRLSERFVFLTGEGLTEEGRNFLLGTGKIVLIKPVNMTTLNSIVDFMLEREPEIAIDIEKGGPMEEEGVEMEEELALGEGEEELHVEETEEILEEIERLAEEEEAAGDILGELEEIAPEQDSKADEPRTGVEDEKVKQKGGKKRKRKRKKGE